jgi:RNA polymerase sigma-54 factor
VTGPRPALSIQMGQQMTLTPQLLQSIRMLQLTTLELEMEMRAAMERNVMLEADEEDDAAGDAEPSEEPDSATEQVAVTGLDCAADRQLQPDFDWSTRESWSGGEPREDDEAIDARRAAPESTDIRVRALEQLRLVIDDPLLAQRAVAIVEHIDDNGYLELSLEQIRQHLPRTSG